MNRDIPDIRRDLALLALITAALSVGAVWWYFRHGELLLWGDAVAHMNIARRVFDSRDPGPLQLGTVWLPLPHLLMLPLLVSNWMWKTGVGGAIPSMLAYLAAGIGIFRLVRTSLGTQAEGRVAAGAAAVIFLLNPNALYMQSVAMTETLCLAFGVWAVVYLADFARRIRGAEMDARGAASALTRCALMIAAQMLTRYDGWFTAAVFSMVVLWLFLRSRARWSDDDRRVISRSVLRYVVLLGATAALWLAYNYALSGDPLAFVRGPYSAKAIDERTSGGLRHPGQDSPKTAAIYFVKNAKMIVAEGRLENTFWYVAMAGVAVVLVLARRAWPLLLLWVPVAFYTFSLAYGSVPIFLPVWWPFSYYNVRFGMQLLPALAVFPAVTAFALATLLGRRQWVPWLALATLIATSYAAVWRAAPICLREARVNSRTRITMEAQVAAALQRMPGDATVLMFLGMHGGAPQSIGMPLRRTINESIKHGWPKALAAPAAGADYVVAFEGDPVAMAVAGHPQGLELVQTIEVPGQATARIYRSESSRSR